VSYRFKAVRSNGRLKVAVKPLRVGVMEMTRKVTGASSVRDSTAVLGKPRVAPPVGPLSVRVTVSVGSTSALGRTGTVKV
jgi:hypothetical protein